VKWSRVCKPRIKGGLGVRDIKLVNLSLLAKWRWKLLNGNDFLWKKVLEEKYGERVITLNDTNGVSWPRFASYWWKDLMMMEGNGGENWFKTEVSRKVGNGMETSFWNDRWKSEGVL